MVAMTALAVPILVSAVIVFIASSIVHMVLPFHRKDLLKLPKEDEVLDALRGFALAPGDYAAPHAGSPQGMKAPEFVEKMRRGPMVLMTLAPGGSTSMGKSLFLWFLNSILV